MQTITSIGLDIATERATLNLRLAIDEITLAVGQPGEETELAIEIVDKVVEYLFRARGSLSGFNAREIERRACSNA